MPHKHVRSHDFSTYADICCSRETRFAQTVTPAAKLSISKNRSTLYRLWSIYQLALSAVYWRNAQNHLLTSGISSKIPSPKNIPVYLFQNLYFSKNFFDEYLSSHIFSAHRYALDFHIPYCWQNRTLDKYHQTPPSCGLSSLWQ